MHTGCFISPFATTQTSRTQIKSSCTFTWLRLKVAACLFFRLLFNFCCLVLFQRCVYQTFSALLMILIEMFLSLRWNSLISPEGSASKVYNHFYLNNLSVKFMIVEPSPLSQFLFFKCKLPLQICTHTPPGGTLLYSTTRWRRGRVTQRPSCSSTVATL